jgi:GMP synthase (glutamine-hydrolysing)
MMRTALAIGHVACEDLGSLETALRRFGFAIETADAAVADLKGIDPLRPDLLVILGGPVSVYDAGAYPFIGDEIALIRARLGAERPTLGICLGAQLMAKALGADVYPGTQGKEIGWAPLLPGKDAARCPALADMAASQLPVLHWHGDTFDLPAGCSHLAATPAYPNQAFAVGRHALALQFHLEVAAAGMERWFVAHACELGQQRIDVAQLRAQSRRFAPALQAAAAAFWENWLTEAFGDAGEDALLPDAGLDIAGRFWLENREGMLAGRGRIELLEYVRDTGSIREAAKAMKMSYKAAWDTVDALNRKACRPVVARTKGGYLGGGSRLTPYGRALVCAYRCMEREQGAFLERLLERYGITPFSDATAGSARDDG